MCPCLAPPCLDLDSMSWYVRSVKITLAAIHVMLNN
jgi:hypothetical protein